jgi:preprotein translocase SecE subunit
MTNPIKAVSDYLKSSTAELKKVTWPSREMTIRYSVMVIVVSLGLAAFFAALDFGLSKAVTAALTARTQSMQAQPPATPPTVTPTVEATASGTSDVKVTPLPIETVPVPQSTPAPGNQGGLKLPSQK